MRGVEGKLVESSGKVNGSSASALSCGYNAGSRLGTGGRVFVGDAVSVYKDCFRRVARRRVVHLYHGRRYMQKREERSRYAALDVESAYRIPGTAFLKWTVGLLQRVS